MFAFCVRIGLILSFFGLALNSQLEGNIIHQTKTLEELYKDGILSSFYDDKKNRETINPIAYLIMVDQNTQLPQTFGELLDFCSHIRVFGHFERARKFLALGARRVMDIREVILAQPPPSLMDPQPRKTLIIIANKAYRIALCFLMYDGSEFNEFLWNEFSNRSRPNTYEFFIHTKGESHKLSKRYDSKVISNRVNDTRWGHISLVQASNNLFKTALDHPSGFTHFILLSGSSIPVKDPEYIRNYLFNHGLEKSHIGLFDGDPIPDIVVHHQWVILSRSHSQDIFAKLDQNPNTLNEFARFGYNPPPDEAFYGTVLDKLGKSSEIIFKEPNDSPWSAFSKTTFVAFRTMSSYPELLTPTRWNSGGPPIYGAAHFGADIGLYKNMSIEAFCELRRNPATLFARKVAPGAADEAYKAVMRRDICKPVVPY